MYKQVLIWLSLGGLTGMILGGRIVSSRVSDPNEHDTRKELAIVESCMIRTHNENVVLRQELDRLSGGTYDFSKTDAHIAALDAKTTPPPPTAGSLSPAL